jgi:hypothetical protein
VDIAKPRCRMRRLAVIRQGWLIELLQPRREDLEFARIRGETILTVSFVGCLERDADPARLATQHL